MIQVRPERFPSRTVKKLQACGAGLFKILKKIGPNAYAVDQQPEYGISSTFNIFDLIKYKEPVVIPSDPFEPTTFIESESQPECLPAKLNKKHDQIERILDKLVVST